MERPGKLAEVRCCSPRTKVDAMGGSGGVDVASEARGGSVAA